MSTFVRLLTAGAIVALSGPVAAQNAYPYQQQYPQGYQQQSYPNGYQPSYSNGYQQQYGYPQQGYQGYGYQQGYGQNGYGYQQGYGQNAVGQIIDQLLGNRYSVRDRAAVSQCASAAIAQAGQYRGYGENGYGNRGLRVRAITNVERRYSGLRVSGILSSGGRYANQSGYGTGELTFRCNVDYRGQVTNIRFGHQGTYRGY